MLRILLIVLTACVFSTATAEETSSAATEEKSAAAAEEKSTAATEEKSSAAAQEKMLTISYGDVSTDIEDANADASGWRINALYETGVKGGNVLHGFSIGYIETTADVTVASQTSNYELKSIPIYYAPKYLIGKKAFKGFIKGALGGHFSEYKRTGALPDIDTNDFGFYGGASAGLMLMLGKKAFINAEYEWAYLSNSYYRDGEVTSAMVGLGFKF